MYVILKKTRNVKHTFLVNDEEGVPMEFKNKEEAERFAEIFRKNSVNGSVYTVRKIGQKFKHQKKMKRIKQFFKYLAWLEQERVKAMIYCGRPMSI